MITNYHILIEHYNAIFLAALICGYINICLALSKMFSNVLPEADQLSTFKYIRNKFGLDIYKSLLIKQRHG